jgi:hypothetical protein
LQGPDARKVERACQHRPACAGRTCRPLLARPLNNRALQLSCVCCLLDKMSLRMDIWTTLQVDHMTTLRRQLDHKGSAFGLTRFACRDSLWMKCRNSGEGISQAILARRALPTIALLSVDSPIQRTCPPCFWGALVGLPDGGMVGFGKASPYLARCKVWVLSLRARRSRRSRNGVTEPA